MNRGFESQGVADQRRDDAPILVVRGSEHQALPQVAAVAAVRGLKRVRVFSPTLEHRGKFVELLKSKYDFEAA